MPSRPEPSLRKARTPLTLALGALLLTSAANPGTSWTLGAAQAREPDGTAASPPTDSTTDLPADLRVPGIPGPVLRLSPTTLTIATLRDSTHPLHVPVIAGAWKEAQAGPGARVVAVGHTGFLAPDFLAQPGARALLHHCLRWAAGRAEGPLRVALLEHASAAPLLEAEGVEVRVLRREVLADAQRASAALKDVDVLALGSHALDAAAIDVVRDLMHGSHGAQPLPVLATGLGWGWLQLNPGKAIREHPGNRLLADMGLAFADGFTRTEVPLAVPDQAAAHTAGQEPRDEDNALHALARLEQLAASPAQPPGAMDAWLVSQGAIVAQAGDFAQRIEALLRERGAGPQRAWQPLDASRTLDRALVGAMLAAPDLHAQALTRLSLDSGFPGAAAADAPRVATTVTVDPARPRWQSTGAYAQPGEAVTLRLASGQSDGLRLRVHVGAHTDRLFHHASWERLPEVIIERAWDGAAPLEVASPFGGLVYVTVEEAAGTEPLRVEVSGAVASPRFVLGSTTPEQWREQRDLPAPWAELESRTLILTVPSEHVRTLDDPAALMTFWDRVLDAQADLAARPHKRESPERIVADRQISAGYMHAGYPIMTHLDAGAFMTNLSDLSRGINAWGLFHELGHNHQESDWTFEGTGEVTVNLFTLYTLDTLCDLSGTRGHEAVDRPAGAVRYLSRQPDFDRWKADPFVALHMYVQMQRAFGWDAFKRVFAEYRALPQQQRPRSDDEKRDQWLTRFSRTVGRDLSAFFERWGVPTSPQTRAALADLPAWMPDDMPALPGTPAPAPEAR